MTYQAVRRTPRPGQPSSTRHLGLRRAGGYACLADAVPVLPPQRLATSATTMPTSARGSGYLPGPPLSHADGKHVVRSWNALVGQMIRSSSMITRAPLLSGTWPQHAPRPSGT